MQKMLKLALNCVRQQNGTLHNVYVFFIFVAEFVQRQNGEPQGWKSNLKSKCKIWRANCLFLHNGEGKFGNQIFKYYKFKQAWR